MSVNKVILVGNVGKDAEVRHIDNGTAVASFSLATSETYTAKSGEKVTSTEWHNVVTWRNLAEFAGKYIQKGKQLYIEGRIRTRSYEDKDGVKKYTTEIIADTIRLLGRKEQENGNVQPTADYQHPVTAANSSSDEIETGDNVNDLPF